MPVLELPSPDGSGSAFVRDDSVVGISAPFSWSAEISARTVQLANGTSVMVRDTEECIAAVISAMGGDAALLNLQTGAR